MTKMSGMPIFRLFCQLMISFRRDWIGVMGKTIAWQKNKKKLKFSTSVNKKKKKNGKFFSSESSSCACRKLVFQKFALAEQRTKFRRSKVSAVSWSSSVYSLTKYLTV